LEALHLPVGAAWAPVDGTNGFRQPAHEIGDDSTI
jgi:hypothetical protein